MCGRYYRRSDKQRIGDAFNISDLPSSLIISEDYNVAPTTFQPVIRNDKETGERELVLMRWGLVPFFTKQLSDVKGISTINAKAENVEKSPHLAHTLSEASLPRAGGWVLRVGATRCEDEAAFCIQDERRRAIRVRRPVGRVERTGRRVAAVLQHRHDRGE